MASGDEAILPMKTAFFYGANQTGAGDYLHKYVEIVRNLFWVASVRPDTHFSFTASAIRP